ncbi:hypothetical protein [Streptomyces sp. NBC_00829]|uniref:hypothetical protein n=1 Tax=Streptomyces sp. NBC_00829 TaxID=2903679 RepID=UPI00386DFA66|nr:hypothetical protein OG293_07580 [Streptomyces sp. NBC_00829]
MPPLHLAQDRLVPSPASPSPRTAGAVPGTFRIRSLPLLPVRASPASASSLGTSDAGEGMVAAVRTMPSPGRRIDD